MSLNKVGKPERVTQDRVVGLFQAKLGYSYLGNWIDRPDNKNVEVELLRNFLLNAQKYHVSLVNKAIFELNKVVLDQSGSLYDANRRVYAMLRYGVKVKSDVGENHETVYFINWKEPLKNSFAIAEEVTVVGNHTKRPDLVIYVNGIALGIIELKRSIVSVGEGIRQNLDNQKETFIKQFFATMQFVTAGNDSEGLRYGTIETSEKHYLSWREISPESNPEDLYLLKATESIRNNAGSVQNLLDQQIIQIFTKERFLEFIHDFVVFDRGIKKLCRQNQYYGIKAAQERIRRREGGIIWHTQGSGKSLTMVWLAKWIRENQDNARILIITDRDELDKQIEKVFAGISETIVRTRSGRDLVTKLNATLPAMICSLIHKFGSSQADDSYEDYIAELKKILPDDFSAKGNIFCFVDECHRSQSGDLHKAMQKLLPNALFIGFTGTPLLKKDKKTSTDVFGSYIHRYRFDEAVRDGVVLDLRYEARNIEQTVISTENLDLLFESKTQGLSPLAKAELKQRWGTMKKVFSSRSRLEKIVADIILDMATRERLQNGRGNAMLVAGSVYQACRYYELFQNAGFRKCAIITSYIPNAQSITGEETGEEGVTEKLLKYKIYREMLAKWFNLSEDEAALKVDIFEDEVTKKFIEEPAQMKLLIVVDKLLTGFDAPSATFLYIDKKMQDHALFQAICRVNRIDDEDKEYGYVIDYQDLFNSLKASVKDYTAGALSGYDTSDVKDLLEDRLGSAKQNFEDALEAIRQLHQAVQPPQTDAAYIRYFCGDDVGDAQKLAETEPKRIILYKSTIAILRTYAAIANEMQECGYTLDQQARFVEEMKGYERARRVVQLASKDYVDLKKYEPAMRHLIDAYIGAEPSKILSKLDDLTLVQLIVNAPEETIKSLEEDLKGDGQAVSETIENNLRKVIVEESPTNPQYYEKMSELLIDLIKLRRERAIEYADYLKKIVELTKQISQPETSKDYSSALSDAAKRALYDNLDKNEQVALELDSAIHATKKDNWRGNKIKEKEVELIVRKVLSGHNITDESRIKQLFEIIKNQRDY